MATPATTTTTSVTICTQSLFTRRRPLDTATMAAPPVARRTTAEHGTQGRTPIVAVALHRCSSCRGTSELSLTPSVGYATHLCFSMVENPLPSHRPPTAAE